VVSLIAAKAYFFCLDTKETKNQVRRNASLPHEAIALQIRQNLGCCLFTLLRPLMPIASVKSRYTLPLHKATIVLPAFTRSCSTDGEEASPKSSPKERTLKEASLRGTKQSLRVKVGTASYETFLFAPYSLEIASYLAMML
jgi:hypothetical protein